MHLMCDIGADARRDVRPQLRRADRESGVGAAIDRHRSARRGTVRGSRVRRETGQRLLNRLELGQRFSELYALVGIVDGQGERRIQRTCHEIGRHTSELQSLMRISYAVFCLKKKNNNTTKYS